MPIPYVPGMPTRAASGGRSYSFEDNMLPPPADTNQAQDQTASFSNYNVNQNSPGAGTLFAQQQSWGYGGPPPDMYGASASPLQPRPTMSYPMMHSGMPRHHGPPQMGHYGNQYYPATSPGPPIQTTPSNKGPDGANLFIFHIPNHFTNVDMYQLFYPYGNLLSVRIMVEKDTGRSRGFGFVSYDTPEAAALAIKELNGFAVSSRRYSIFDLIATDMLTLRFISLSDWKQTLESSTQANPSFRTAVGPESTSKPPIWVRQPRRTQSSSWIVASLGSQRDVVWTT